MPTEEAKARARTRCAAARRAARKGVNGLGRHDVRKVGRPSVEELAVLRARMPPDTRDLTGRLMNDPLPGRSALDKRS